MNIGTIAHAVRHEVLSADVAESGVVTSIDIETKSSSWEHRQAYESELKTVCQRSVHQGSIHYE